MSDPDKQYRISIRCADGPEYRKLKYLINQTLIDHQLEVGRATQARALIDALEKRRKP
jgi:hypothetical protein